MTDTHDGGLVQGISTIRVRPETMHKIVQAWIEAELASPVAVKGVKRIGTPDRFEIAFERIAARSEDKP